MNQSIFIAGNDPSLCLVCAHRTQRPSVLNVGEVSANTSKEGSKEEGSDTNPNGDEIKREKVSLGDGEGGMEG